MRYKARMGDLIHFPRARADVPLSKKQLAAMLGFTTRWLELRVAEGMPSWMERGRRMFYVSDVNAWLEEREAGPPKAPEPEPDKSNESDQVEPEPDDSPPDLIA